MILVAGASTFWVEIDSVATAEQSALKTVAQNLADHIDTQLATLQQSVDGVAQSADVITALGSGNIQLIQATEAKLQHSVPKSMRLRLLPPNVSDPDQTSVPHMGFGDVEMVRATLSGQPKPVIQGEGEQRHLAITSAVIANNQVVGVVLASLKPDIAQAILARTSFDHGFIELKQEQVSLGSLGRSEARNDDPDIINLKEGRWQIHLWPDVDSTSGHSLLITALVSINALFSSLIFFIGYRKLTALLRQDQSSVLKAAKEIMQGKQIGTYPIQLDEMLPMVTSLAQFKRILDKDILAVEPALLSKERDFFDESFDIDFLEEAPPASQASQAIREQQVSPVSMPIYHDFDNDDLPPPSPPTDNSSKSLPIKSDDDEFVATASVSESLMPDSWDLDSVFSISSQETIASPSEPEVINEQIQLDFQDNIFRDASILGVVGESLNQEIMTRLGGAVASEARQLSIKNIVVARDSRASSQALADALINGIIEAGCDVLDIGQATTPILYFVAHHTEGRTGVMVTGGEAPEHCNGLRWIMNDEMPTSQNQKALKHRFDSNEFFRTGSGSVEHNTLFRNEYIGSIADETHIVRPMTIVLDCAGGAAAQIGPALLKTIGCEVIELKTRPHRATPAEPSPSFDDLIEAIKINQADLGIYLPHDGCRMMVVDSRGKIIWPDRQMMLFARDILATRTGGQILHDAGCSKHLPEQIKRRGGRPLQCKSNPAIIRTTLKQTGAALAGTFSGHMFFNDRWLGFDDGLYAAVRLIEILSNDIRPSAEVFDDLPDSITTPPLWVALNDHESEHFIEQLSSQSQFNARLDNTEGLKVTTTDAWGMIRESTTGPGLVMRFEADTSEALQRIQAQFRNEMLKIRPNISLPF